MQPSAILHCLRSCEPTALDRIKAREFLVDENDLRFMVGNEGRVRIRHDLDEDKFEIRIDAGDFMEAFRGSVYYDELIPAIETSDVV